MIDDDPTLLVSDQRQTDAIRCYECGGEYSYIGQEGPHPGTCHHCGSAAVDPSGELTFERVDALEVGTTPEMPTSTMRVVATDAHDREFEFWLHIDPVDLDAAASADAGAGGAGAGSPVESAAEAAGDTTTEEIEAVLWRVYADGVELSPPNVGGEPVCPLSALEDLLSSTTVPERFRADVITPVVADQIDGGSTTRDSFGDRTQDDSSEPFDDDYWF